MKAISLLFLLAACAAKDELSPDSILNRKLKQCYEESDSYLKRRGGKIETWLGMNADGTVRMTKIHKSDFQSDRNLEACVTGVYKQTKFLPTVDGKDTEIMKSVNFEAVKL